MNYLDKYKGLNDRNSIYDILSLDPNIPADWEIISREYVATDIEKVVIGGNTFTNYGDFQFVWEKSYVKEPERSGNGSIGNLNSYATFITPHLLMNFSVMSIDDYRAIMRMDLEQNEFVVECYDPIYNTTITKKMYFATPQMAKLFTIAKVRFNGETWEEFVELVGVKEYTVELIGTNASLDLVSVVYHLNPPETTGYNDYFLSEDAVYNGEEIIIGGAASDIVNETFGDTYKFSKWNISRQNPTQPKPQGNYINGNAYTINSDLVLYAQWEATTNHTLTLNYGVADPVIEDQNYSYVASKIVEEGQPIGTLPTPTPPAVIYNGAVYTGVYYNGSWHKGPSKSYSQVTNNELYWYSHSSTIYLLFDVKTIRLLLYLDGDLYQENWIPYGAPLTLPNLVKSGYAFDGWYTDNTYTKKFSESTMPPIGLNLYARWNKND